MGSVKDLTVIEAATPSRMGLGRFFFSDRYSVFDWGEMPDLIPHKGEAIAILGAWFFERLDEEGVATHYVGLEEGGEARRLADLSGPSAAMRVRLLDVIKPGLKGDSYDYSAYRSARGGFLIPLEVIYRNSLPEGSSVFKRLQSGSVTPQDLGLDSMPVPGQRFSEPLMDVSTKLEITDRYMTWEEAREISRMSEAETDALKELTRTVNRFITDTYSQLDLVNEDGKIEAGFDPNRRLMLVDVLGTLDECRFTHDGQPVSKEIARIWYRDTEWFKDTEEAKKQDRQRWKEICASQPEPLPTGFRDLISHVYCACTNEITGRQWFEGIPPLADILAGLKRFTGA